MQTEYLGLFEKFQCRYMYVQNWRGDQGEVEVVEWFQGLPQQPKQWSLLITLGLNLLWIKPWG